MQVGTDYTQSGLISSLLGSIATSTTSSTSGTSSLFGPATTLSLGSRSTTSTSGGYSHLGASVAQFDATSILTAQYTATTTTQMSAKALSEQSDGLQSVSGLLDVGRYAEARALAEQLHEKYPTSGPVTHALGVIELTQQNYAEAERYFRQAHYLAPDRGYNSDADVAHQLQNDDDEVFSTARRMVAGSDTRDEGLQLLVGLTQRNPVHTEARMILAEELMNQGDAASSLSQYRMAIGIADEEQLARIEDQLSELVDTAPKAAYVRRLLGETQLRLGKHTEAAATLAAATELSENDALYRAAEAPAHIAIGRDKLSRHDVVGAIASLEYARSLDYGNSDVRVALGEAYIARAELRTRQGSASAAITDLVAASGSLGTYDDDTLSARLARAAFAAGLAIEVQHRASGASVGVEATAFKLAYDTDPNNATYRAKWAEVSSRAGDEFLADEDYLSAAEAYERAYNLFKNNQTHRDSAVNAYLLYGDEQTDKYQHDEAISAYGSAYDIQRSDAARLKLASAHNARGLVRLAEGKMRLAREDFLRATRLDPTNSDYQDNYNSAVS